MKKVLVAVFVSTLFSGHSTVFAEEQTVKLSVPGMSCVSCPYMVKQAISMVDGIKFVEATMTDRSATVTFEDTIATVKDIQQATANIGYPSTLFEESSGS